MPDKTPPSNPLPGEPPLHPQPHHTHEWDPPTPIKIREDQILHERIQREKDPSGPVAGHGDPEHEHDHGR